MAKPSAQYSIRLLADPETSIVPDDISSKITGGAWKIEGFTFPEISLKLPIRSKAAQFAKKQISKDFNPPTYVCLYSDEKGIHCLYLFRFLYLTRKNMPCRQLVFCRCIGKNFVKQHRDFIFKRIEGYTEKILSLEKDSRPITFNVY